MHINHCASWVFHIRLPKELILILLVCRFGSFLPAIKINDIVIIIILLNIKGITRADTSSEEDKLQAPTTNAPYLSYHDSDHSIHSNLQPGPQNQLYPNYYSTGKVAVGVFERKPRGPLRWLVQFLFADSLCITLTVSTIPSVRFWIFRVLEQSALWLVWFGLV